MRDTYLRGHALAEPDPVLDAMEPIQRRNHLIARQAITERLKREHDARVAAALAAWVRRDVAEGAQQ